MARTTEDKALALLLLFLSTAALFTAALVPSRFVSVFAAMLGGIALTFFAVALVSELDEADDFQDELCPHFSANTLTNAAGDVFHFCDDCGDQLSRFDINAEEDS